MSAIPRAVREFHPNAAVLQVASFALAERFIGGGVPCIVYLRDGDFARLGGPIREAPNLRYLATSRDLVRRFEQSFGIVPLCLPPVVRAERYRVAPRRTNVTFVCPFPTKGVDIALHLAAQRPDIPFAFVESWHLPLPRRFALHRRLRTTPNVTYRPRSDDMRAVYREAKALLVPSRTAEGWGRVVSEAQVSGLPVIATDYGALPEAVGPGGILVDPAADLGEWEDAVARIWDDDAEYERLAALAEAHARRPEFRPAALIEKLLAVLSDLIET